MIHFDPLAYGNACAELLQEEQSCELKPGAPNRAAADHLRALDHHTLFNHEPVVDRDMASCCLSALWLLHNYLDESHRISQGIDTPSGSFWHGIMHRREPDFSNAKYWFRRVGEHPVFERLCEAAREIAGDGATDSPSEYLKEQRMWDPFRFVDLCEDVIGGRSISEQVCREIAQAEWWLLFDYCYRQAIGGRSHF